LILVVISPLAPPVTHQGNAARAQAAEPAAPAQRPAADSKTLADAKWWLAQAVDDLLAAAGDPSAAPRNLREVFEHLVALQAAAGDGVAVKSSVKRFRDRIAALSRDDTDRKHWLEYYNEDEAVSKAFRDAKAFWRKNEDSLAGGPAAWREAKRSAAEVSAGQQINLYLKIADAENKAGDKTAARATLALAQAAAEAEREDLSHDRFLKVASAQMAIGDNDGARATLAIAQARVRRGHYGHWCDIGVAQARAGDVEGSRASFALAKADHRAGPPPELLSRKVQPDQYGALQIAKAEAEAGHFAAAKRTAAAIDDPHIRGLALSEVAAAQFRAGDLTGAEQTAAGPLNVFALVKYAVAQAEAGDVPAARATLARVKARDVRTAGYFELALVHVKAGNVAAVKALLENEAAGVGDWHRTDGYCKLAAAQASAGDAAAAAESMAEAHDALERHLRTTGDVPSNVTRLQVAMCKAYTDLGDFAAAGRVADGINTKWGDWDRSKSEEYLIAAMVSAGKLEALARRIEGQSDPYLRVQQRLKVAETLLVRAKPGRLP
jgi:hypothetical protein